MYLKVDRKHPLAKTSCVLKRDVFLRQFDSLDL